MTAETWSRLKAVFDACLELDPPVCRAYLDAHCPDSEIRREVESLLDSHRQAGDFIERPALDDSPSARRIGVWELAGKIGEGGIGRVYRARRAADGFEQIAALKLLKLGLEGEELGRHFLSERRILAALDHPNIARLIDGGIAADGRPYLVMEFVAGIAIDAFVDRHRLPPREICALFRQVCAAVDYAHRHLVVHRDLKPSNVLVTAAGEARLLDFGIAKILGDDETHTATGVRLLTPDYASPEQIRGETVTTASDVYSLGVMLYRLLAKRSPYCVTGSSELAVAVALAREEILPPSAAAASAALRQALAGDLDTIVVKALEPDPARRYSSAAELAADLARYESGFPILARPQTLRYRLRKLVARNRLSAAVTVLATLAIVAGVSATLWEARVARAERRLAERRYDDVRRLANSLLFDVHDAIQDLPGATQASALVVARATEYLDRVSADVPADGRVRLEVANAYLRLGDVQGNPANSNLGDRDKARQDFRKAVALLEPLAKASADPQVRSALATAYDKVGGLENAKRALAILEALARAAPADPAARAGLARGYYAVGVALVDQRQYAQALEWFTRDRDLVRALQASRPDDSSLLQHYGVTLKHSGAALIMLHRLPEALASYQQALAVEERRARNQSTPEAQMAISFSQSDIALVYFQQKLYAESIRHYRKALAIRENLRARDSHDDRARWGVWSASRRLGMVYQAAGRPQEALLWLLKSEQASRPEAPLANTDSDRLTQWMESCADLARASNSPEAARWSRQTQEANRELQRRKQN